jgi:phosphate transport system substrate-binding protein
MRNRTLFVAVAGATLALLGCSKSQEPVKASASATASGDTAPRSGERVNLQGAGATFPYPLYSKWVDEYQKSHPSVRINYQSIGSGGGIKQIIERTVDFGASDAPMNDQEMAKAPGKLLHIPTTIGSVVLAYNVPGVAAGLKLTPEVLSAIFLGEIKTWNDPKLVELNPDLKLPGDAITVAYRSDGSGTTAVFTDYLAAVSPAWKEKVGAGKSVKFPVGLGAKGNEGVAGQVKTTPGTIGYIELAYAKQTNLSYATLRNAAGKWVEPSLESITAAGASVVATMPEDLRQNIVNPGGDAAYPLSAFTYILVYQDMADATKAKALLDFLWWAVHDGQKLGGALHHAPLPQEMVARNEALLKSITAGGKPVL